MNSKGKKPSEWASRAGRLLSLCTATERILKEFNPHVFGDVYTPMREGLEKLQAAFHQADKLREVEGTLKVINKGKV